MKKEQKRYTIAEYIGEGSRIVNNEEEYKELLKKIENYNSKKTAPSMIGNIYKQYISNGRINVRFGIYIKLENAMTISQIDELTTSYTENEFIKKYSTKLKSTLTNKPVIQIVYFKTDNKSKYQNDIKLKNIPVIYNEDKNYLDENYIRSCIEELAKNTKLTFFNNVIYKFKHYKQVEDEIDDLRELINDYFDSETNRMLLSSKTQKIFDKLIIECDKEGNPILDENNKTQISKRRLRDFGLVIKKYDTLIFEKNTTKRSMKEKYQSLKKEVEEVTEKYDEKYQEELAIIYWDQQNGNYYSDYQVDIDPKTKKFRKI